MFNNVAVGAAYARAVHGRPRVMQSHGACDAPPLISSLSLGTRPHIGRSRRVGAQAACDRSRVPFSAWQWCGGVTTACTARTHADPCLLYVAGRAQVDFDIHHGNGTEEIVKCLAPHEQKLPLPPGWPPQTRHVHRPWLNAHDAENVFFASVHLYAVRC